MESKNKITSKRKRKSVRKSGQAIVFTGGGTGGHIYPGIAVAEVLQDLIAKEGKKAGEEGERAERKIKFLWIGSKSDKDYTLISKYIDKGVIDSFYAISSGKLRRYLSIKNFFDLFRIVFGFLQSILLLKKLSPLLVFSKGGFVSVPVCAAASLLKLKVYTHESDYTLGLANRINARFVKTLFVTYEDTLTKLNEKTRRKALVVGNPIRSELYLADKERGRAFLKLNSSLPILLVLGGSLGAKEVNDLVFDNLTFLTSHFFVVHQTGKNTPPPSPPPKNYLSFPFIYDEIFDLQAASTLILGRAGAGSIWEAASLGIPQVLYPLSSAASRGDQVDNALYFQKNNLALTIGLPLPSTKSIDPNSSNEGKDKYKAESKEEKKCRVKTELKEAIFSLLDPNIYNKMVESIKTFMQKKKAASLIALNLLNDLQEDIR